MQGAQTFGEHLSGQRDTVYKCSIALKDDPVDPWRMHGAHQVNALQLRGPEELLTFSIGYY